MKRTRCKWLVAGVLLLGIAGFWISRSAPQAATIRFIGFDDLAPAGTTPRELWHGIGSDSQGRIYTAICTQEEMRESLGDVLIFQYDTRTGERRFLKSVRQILQEEGNLGPNAHWPGVESVAKIHTDIREHNGRMVFATCDLHYYSNPLDHRGSHFLSYDPATDVFTDLSKREPDGVSVPHEAITAMNVLRAENRLVGWNYPSGRIVEHDLNTGQSTLYPRGLSEETPADIARIVMTTRKGDVFAAYTVGKYFARHTRFFKLDREQGRLVSRPDMDQGKGFFEGIQETADGNTIYLSDFDGTIYAFDVAQDRLRRVTSMLPFRLLTPVVRVRNLALSPDERKLYVLPYPHDKLFTFWRLLQPAGAYHLYEYDLQTGIRRDLGDFSPLLKRSVLCGNGVFDEAGRFYLPCFAKNGARAGLLQVDPGTQH